MALCSDFVHCILRIFLDFCNALFICVKCFEWMMRGHLLIFKTGNSTNQAVVYEVKLTKFRFMLFDVRDAHSFSVPPRLGKDSKTAKSFFHLILHSWPSKATRAQKKPEGGGHSKLRKLKVRFEGMEGVALCVPHRVCISAASACVTDKDVF